jgi:hypothetical protein
MPEIVVILAVMLDRVQEVVVEEVLIMQHKTISFLGLVVLES